tara:strand:+ start:278 stop:535 length:258 start_codon:yes stop_codon:yes gene_type:complete
MYNFYDNSELVDVKDFIETKVHRLITSEIAKSKLDHAVDYEALQVIIGNNIDIKTILEKATGITKNLNDLSKCTVKLSSTLYKLK